MKCEQEGLLQEPRASKSPAPLLRCHNDSAPVLRPKTDRRSRGRSVSGLERDRLKLGYHGLSWTWLLPALTAGCGQVMAIPRPTLLSRTDYEAVLNESASCGPVVGMGHKVHITMGQWTLGDSLLPCVLERQLVLARDGINWVAGLPTTDRRIEVVVMN